MTAIALEQASIHYGKHEAVRQASLQIEPGQLHVLLGRSGSGKTTLLRAIAGFERLSGGSLHLHGELVDNGARHWCPPERRNVGLVFQDYALFPHLDVGGNLKFGAPSLSPQQLQQQLARVGLEGYQGRATSALSGGEQQRVALARALAAQPGLLLLDEPFSNLDRQLRQQLRERTVDLLREAGITAVFVTHDAAEAFALGDRLSVMHQGQLLQTGPGPDLYRDPVNREVAQALGPCLLLEATASAGGEVAQTPLGAIPLRRPARPQDSQLLLRPEQLQVTALQAEAQHTQHQDLGPVKLTRRVYQGDHYLLELQHPGATVRARVEADRAPQGDSLRLWLKGSGVMV